jgi:glucokinase
MRYTPTMEVRDDPRTILTLDAGGTRFVFSALRGGREVAGPLELPSRGDDLDACIRTFHRGFEALGRAAGAEVSAISFGFPGPADYRAGIVGPQKNLPCIREPLALCDLLTERFGIPVFIHNDADLFVLGEALGGFLPWVNGLLDGAGSPFRHRALFGITLGTGLGAGYTLDGRMVTGDHGGGPEIWCVPSGPDPSRPAEEFASARAVKRSYAELAGIALEDAPDPHILRGIAEGRAPGSSAAAREAFRRLGSAAGHASASALTVLDCPLVVGGGLSGAGALLLPALVEALNARLEMTGAGSTSRLDGLACDLEDPAGREVFLRDVAAPDGIGLRRFPVGFTRMGTSRAAALGAYAAAIEALDRR